MNIKESILLRVRIAFLAVIAFVLVVIYRIADIQFVQGDEWRKEAQEIGLDYKTIKATRGSIYADGNDLMATSLPFYKIALDPSLANDNTFKTGIDSLSLLLSKFFRDRSPGEYRKKISEARQSRKRYLVLNNNLINYQNKEMMEKWPIFREGQMIGGVIFDKFDERHRPFKTLAQRTIGGVNKDGEATVGIEKSYDQFLAGQDGKGLYQRIAGGNWMPVNVASDVKPRNGYDVFTTIDINLQDVAQNSLLRQLERFEAAYGTVVLMEVKTGEIKAMSNLTRTESGSYVEDYNYAVQGLNDPGSTFKLASMLALLEADKIELTDSVDTGDGTVKFYDRSMEDQSAWKGGYGKLTVQEVFEKSSNVGVSKLVDQYFGKNPQRYIDIIKSTGLGQPLDFQMMGEGIPYIKNTDDKSWSGTSLPWMSVGYETAITPLQTLAFYNAVANDGKMIQPIIVKSIRKGNQIVEEFKAKTLDKKIASKATLEKLKIMLEGVVERGTAKNIKNDFYKIAGKTGTAQKLINGRYYKQRYYASFAGYFPADEPLYSCIVVIDDPKGWNSFGGDVSAPVFKEIADMIFALDLGLHDTFKEERLAKEGTFPVIRAGNYDELNQLLNQFGISNHMEEENTEWVRASVSNNAIAWKSNHPESNLVPNVEGMTLRDALYILENKGLKVNVSGTGRVLRQSISRGKRIVKGTTINIELG
ncbi:penicillin-binding protein [Roseivirga sp.]|uniref:penicillin-binding protein n=1 Tax=Roseivirga sp. TaxID=1964215 RepID=UPI002B2775DA|nr:penicillin-binding protein [Roseivirga sp.]